MVTAVLWFALLTFKMGIRVKISGCCFWKSSVFVVWNTQFVWGKNLSGVNKDVFLNWARLVWTFHVNDHLIQTCGPANSCIAHQYVQISEYNLQTQSRQWKRSGWDSLQDPSLHMWLMKNDEIRSTWVVNMYRNKQIIYRYIYIYR